MTERFELFGLPRSGTNIVHYILPHNYDCALSQAWGNKHYATKRPLKDKPRHIIIVVKHPLSWFVSLFHWVEGRYGVSHDFEDLLFTTRSLGMRFVGTAIDHWNQINADWMKMASPEQKVVIIPYERLLTKGDEFCDKIMEELGIERLSKNFDFPHYKMGTNHCPKHNEKFNFNYYLREKYMDEYHPGLLKKLRKKVDISLMERLGYARF